MRKINLSILLLVVMAAFIFGCSDDNNSVGSSANSIHARGYVMLNPYLIGEIQLNGISPALPAVDSVTIADSVMYLSNSKPTDNLYRSDLYASYYNRDDSLRLVSGDLIPITIYTPKGNSFCETRILNNKTDSLFVVEGSIPTSVPQYGFFTVHWHPVPQADWYLIEMSSHGPSGPSVTGFAVDTLFLIDSLFTRYNFSFTIQPVIGPLPTDLKGNITGGPVVGSIYSTTWGTYLSVTVDSPKKATVESEAVYERSDPFRALDELLDSYQK